MLLADAGGVEVVRSLLLSYSGASCRLATPGGKYSQTRLLLAGIAFLSQRLPRLPLWSKGQEEEREGVGSVAWDRNTRHNSVSPHRSHRSRANVG